MKNKLKDGWQPRSKSRMPQKRNPVTGQLEDWQQPKPTKPTQYTNYVRHQISKANRAVKEGKA